VPARAPLSWVALLAAGLALGGCTQPGTQAPPLDAQRLDEATSAMTSACGEAQQTSGLSPQASVASFDAAASAGARTLIGVWRKNRTWIYQGETVNGIVSDSILLLGDCGLSRAQHALERGIGASGSG
jgi:hypothetical protein